MIRKIALGFCLIVWCPLLGSAQVQGGSDEFNKLFDLFALEKYEDCYYRAASSSEKEKYSKSPEPWLYMSMCLLRIRDVKDEEELEEEYPKSFQNSLKYAAKFRKKDKSGEIYEQNIDYFDELKEKGCQEAHWHLGEDKPKKAASAYKLVYKIDKDDRNVQFMVATCYGMSKLVGDAKLYFKEAIPGLEAKYADSSYEPNKVTEPVLVEAVILWSDWLYANNLQDSARAVVARGKKWIPEDADLAKQAEKLAGS